MGLVEIAVADGYPFGKVSFVATAVATKCPFSLLPGGRGCEDKNQKEPPRKECRECSHRKGNKR